MAEVLSQQQIDDLLGSLQTGRIDLGGEGRKVKEYDFTSPKKFTKDQMKLLDGVFGGFARMFSLYLTSTLRCVCKLEILQIEEEEYRDFNNALSDSVLAGIISLGKNSEGVEDKPIMTEVSRPVFFSIMDRLLGGNGEGYLVERECTEIEVALLEYLIKHMCKFFNHAWANYFEVEHNLLRIETNSRLIQTFQPDEAVAIVVLEVALPNLKGHLNICIPASSVSEIMSSYEAKFLQPTARETGESEKKRRDSILGGLSTSALAVKADLGTATVTLEDVLNLKTGDVLMLDTPANGAQVMLSVEDTPWFTGELGVSKKKYAVRLHQQQT